MPSVMTLVASTDRAVGPVATTERIDVLDVLRGAAVYGILLYNIGSLSGYDFISPDQRSRLGPPGADQRLAFLLEFLVQGKFYCLFSFLFGVGFSVFIQRAQARGGEAVRLFKRRLLGLLLIGLVHSILIWMGDILTAYAVLGFALIPFVRRDDRSVLRWSVAMFAAPVPLYLVMLGLATFVPQPKTAGGDALPPILARAVDGFVLGSYLDVVRGNVVFTIANVLRRLLLMFFPRVFGMFLLGFYAGRRGLFADLDANGTLIRWTFCGGLLLGLPLAFAGAWLGDSGSPRPPTLLGLVEVIVESIGTPLLSLAYAAGICLLYQRWRAVRSLAPAGRMALSNYLFQSIAGVALFYGIGFGLFGRVGLSLVVFGATVFFGLQIVFSRWWLEQAAFGPAEWIWRQFTYRQRFALWR